MSVTNTACAAAIPIRTILVLIFSSLGKSYAARLREVLLHQLQTGRSQVVSVRGFKVKGCLGFRFQGLGFRA